MSARHERAGGGGADRGRLRVREEPHEARYSVSLDGAVLAGERGAQVANVARGFGADGGLQVPEQRREHVHRVRAERVLCVHPHAKVQRVQH